MSVVVVCGGSGFLGSHAVDALHAQGHTVRVFDLTPSPFLPEGAEMIVGDIMNPEQVAKAVAGSDYVFNFAGIADLDDASTRPIDTVHLNIVGNLNVLEAIVKMERKPRYIYASTIYVYSNKGGFYRCSKQSSELYIEEYARVHELEYTILRYGTLYGPRADARNSIWRHLHSALTTGKISVSGTGKEIREYIEVRDAAELTVQVLTDDFINEYVVLTGHHPTRLNDLMSMIQEMLGNKVEVEYLGRDSKDHYSITPYSYVPKIGKKFTKNLYRDLGQCLLECISDMDQKRNEES